MPQNERMRVWNEELKKTSGGLTKGMLMKNKRGKIVSKKKSEAAKKSNENNLGSWLRSKGDKFDGEPKGFKVEDKKPKIEQKVKKEKVVNPPKKAAPKKKKAVPKKVVNAPKKAVPKKVANAPKRLTMEPMKAGEEKDLQKISVGNIIVDRPKRPRRKRIQKQSVFGDYDSDDD